MAVVAGSCAGVRHAALGAARVESHHRPTSRRGGFDRMAGSRGSGGNHRDPRNCVARQRGCGEELMRILVAGATSVPGIPLLRELNARGHDVIGMTSQPAKTAQIEQQGAKPVVADVFDAAQIDAVVADIEPEVVVSLLTTLPKRGPMRVKDFEPARALWGRGAPNLVAAAQRARLRRVVAESVIFAYGYPSTGSAIMDESDPYPGPPPPGGAGAASGVAGHDACV